MNQNRLMWGIVLLFVGGVLLLENFNIIEFYWRNVWKFWPAFLIVAGINILFNRQRSQTGTIISVSVLVIMLGFLFYRGQEPPHKRSWAGIHLDGMDDMEDLDQDDSLAYQNLNFFETFNGDSSKNVTLNISGGGTSFSLEGPTDSLIYADVKNNKGNFSLKKETTDSTQTLTFKSNKKGGRWHMDDGGNDVDFKFNTQPTWNILMKMGAGEVDFDLSEYKVRTFKFEGGAASMELKMGDLLPITDVVIKTGVADVKINIPTGSGCRITTKTGLSAKDFTGFTKLENGTYETPNYQGSANKIFIRMDGGLSNFEVRRY